MLSPGAHLFLSSSSQSFPSSHLFISFDIVATAMLSYTLVVVPIDASISPHWLSYSRRIDFKFSSIHFTAALNQCVLNNKAVLVYIILFPVLMIDMDPRPLNIVATLYSQTPPRYIILYRSLLLYERHSYIINNICSIFSVWWNVNALIDSWIILLAL